MTEFPRFAPSLCISYSKISDIHGITMKKYILSAPYSGKKYSFSPHIIPKTNGLEESLSIQILFWIHSIQNLVTTSLGQAMPT